MDERDRLAELIQEVHDIRAILRDVIVDVTGLKGQMRFIAVIATAILTGLVTFAVLVAIGVIL